MTAHQSTACLPSALRACVVRMPAFLTVFAAGRFAYRLSSLAVSLLDFRLACLPVGLAAFMAGCVADGWLQFLLSCLVLSCIAMSVSVSVSRWSVSRFSVCRCLSLCCAVCIPSLYACLCLLSLSLWSSFRLRIFPSESLSDRLSVSVCLPVSVSLSRFACCLSACFA